ncbi:ParB/Srx family N-terminal domain-containing protein [Bordetella hinzii]|uniref:Chromosome partitioning protein ParB n=1 Tax=Bordetella hinzii TaxID=103855 RepID=A0AAN1S0K6_9BORD|nr:ParB/Srx family N-terminal domain-containing protein [Bordetella hinzii]AKQ60030.1 Putative ParB-like nuclease [Bordetella hinzii]AZW18878.1 chromosome partitioning protein ParB [Bordetella hinzii]MBZ0073273.1 ParB/Srx family N-terminal domain-containing protein [Bordetella hinzii]MBZ0078251.1 ParB/Srx family N-terminal domain-containing protein [Bordetella hinzii]MBZ0082070.1 ParB/Srx family N-terminal domain-containing protein [Bordetella hinzii]
MQAANPRKAIRYRRWMAILVLPLALAACSSSDHDDDQAAAPPATTPPATTEPARNTAYLNTQAGDVIAVRIEELRPTQAAIGYDQIYYKLGRWQGDFDRPNWQGNDAQMLDYLNRTVGKKFDDYCEDTGQDARAQAFQTLAEARAARLDDPATFACKDAPGTHADAMKTVVVGWDGNLYLTDGHHSFSSLREIFDGGPKLKVWVKVNANYSDMTSAAAFWQRMVDEGRAWLRDGANQAITVDQLPTRLGLASDSEPGGMQEDPYRSLVYFTRDIGYTNGGLPEFAEFLWGEWLRKETEAGRLPPMSAFKLKAPDSAADILAVSTLKKDLTRADSNTSYAAFVREAALRMSSLADGDVVFGDRTAAQLGRVALVAGADSGTPTKTARDTLEELPRNDVKTDLSPRGAGKLWFAVNYRACGKPAAGTCWGW